MKIGFLGLGRMGANMVKRLLNEGHEVVVWNRTWSKVEAIMAEGAQGARTLAELVEQLEGPRFIWTMLPAGEVTTEALDELLPLLQSGDTLIDGAIPTGVTPRPRLSV